MPRPDKQRSTSTTSSRPPKKSQQQNTKSPSCLVCKFRRVKCDGAWPTCGQCKQVKRACPGYPDDPKQRGPVRTTTPALTHEDSSSSTEPHNIRGNNSDDDDEDDDVEDEIESRAALALRTPPRTPEPKPLGLATTSSNPPLTKTQPIDFTSSPLLPLYASPERSTPEDGLVYMYRRRTMPALHPVALEGVVSSWRTLLLQAVDVSPTLRYVASSLASYHENFLSASTTSGLIAAKYYGKGLTSMTNSFGNASSDPETLVFLMLSASILLGVEYFRRNYPAIRIHLESIIKVLGQRPNENMTVNLDIAEQFFRRTYLYFSFFPSVYPTFNTLKPTEVPYRSWIPEPQPSYFTTFADADSNFHQILFPWMFYSQALQRNPGLAFHPSAAQRRDSLLHALRTWSKAFETFLSTSYTFLPEQTQVLADTYLVWLAMVELRIQYSLTIGETLWDEHATLFKSLLTRSASVDKRMIRHTKISLEPVLGIQTVKFWVLVKCRDPSTRREALRFINQAKVTHAQWYPPATVRVGLRVVEIEEAGWERRVEEEEDRLEMEKSIGSPSSISSYPSSSGGLRASHMQDQSAGSVGSGRGASPAYSSGKVSSPPELRKVVDAREIAELDRLRDVRFHLNVANGTVELAYICWCGEQLGWNERREVLPLGGS